MIPPKYCHNCHRKVRVERCKELRKEYPYVCLHCDENMCRIEVTTRRDRLNRLARLNGWKSREEMYANARVWLSLE